MLYFLSHASLSIISATLYKLRSNQLCHCLVDTAQYLLQNTCLAGTSRYIIAAPNTHASAFTPTACTLLRHQNLLEFNRSLGRDLCGGVHSVEVAGKHKLLDEELVVGHHVQHALETARGAYEQHAVLSLQLHKLPGRAVLDGLLGEVREVVPGLHTHTHTRF